MPDTNAGVLTDNLLRRLRDPSAVGLQRSFVRRILSDSQRLVNAHERKTKESVMFTTNPLQQFYKVQENFSHSIRIEFVREGGRDLRKTDIRSLTQINTKWFRKVGPRFEHFALVGRDLLVIYPAKIWESSVEVVYTKLTTELDADDVEVELPDDDMVQASDLAQIILLCKMRRIETIAPLLEQFMSRNQLIEANAKT